MVPNGFQHINGLGNFPSDWQVTSADCVTTKITKGTTPPKSEIVQDSNIPFLRVNNLSFNGRLNSSSEMLFVSSDAHESFLARSKAYPDDILMNIVGPPLGKISMLDKQYDSYNMNQAIVIYRTSPEHIDKYYFLKFLTSELAQQWLQSRSKKTSGQQNLTIQLCKELPVPVPPLPEQRKIAQILSTWDKAINTTARLIDNSKQQKKALMQQLLTGKKRLLDDSGKPFADEWKEVKLGEISYITTGSSNREDSSLDGEYTFFDRSEDIRTSSRYLFDSEAVIVPGEGQDFVPKHFEGKFDLHQRTYAIMNFEGCVGRFLFYYIGYYRHYFLAQAVGSTVKSLRLPMFQKMPIKHPNKLEQAKIASVINNADQEIIRLEQQLADLKQEKKALMQQLLTGKRRVKLQNKELA